MNELFPVGLSDALWSSQSALLREVTPDLRAVAVEAGERVRLRCIYDRPIDEDLRQVVSMIEDEVLIHYPDPRVSAVAETQMDDSIILTASETPVYHRREPNPLNMPAEAAHPGGHPDMLRDDELSKPTVTRRLLGLHAVQAALLGEVTPDLRAVTVDPTDGVRVRLIYDRPIDAEINATVALVDAATRANLHLDDAVTTRAECVPDGRIPASDAEVYAYARKEGEW